MICEEMFSSNSFTFYVYTFSSTSLGFRQEHKRFLFLQMNEKRKASRRLKVLKPPDPVSLYFRWAALSFVEDKTERKRSTKSSLQVPYSHITSVTLCLFQFTREYGVHTEDIRCTMCVYVSDGVVLNEKSELQGSFKFFGVHHVL